MMFASLASVILPLALTAASSWARPMLNLNIPRSTPGPWCDGLGPGAFDIAYNFTLAAYNTTLPNANTTGSPLVLGQNGAISGAQFKVLSTYSSFPYDEFPNLSLLNGGLVPNQLGVLSRAGGTNATAGNVLSFVVTSVNPPPPAQIYCGVANTDPYGGGTGYPLLAVHGDTDSFSLCRAGDSLVAQTNVVYKAGAGSFDSHDCYPVRLQIVGLF